MSQEELQNLYDDFYEAAKLTGDASILEDSDVEEYINTKQTQDGKTLKEIGVKNSDIFSFIKSFLKADETSDIQATKTNDNWLNDIDNMHWFSIYNRNHAVNLKSSKKEPFDLK